MKELSVLVPTYGKGDNSILPLLKVLNIKGLAIVSNQSDKDGISRNGETTIINTKTRGVSVNRNILLNNIESNYCLFIDDDCRLLEGYEEIVLNEFNKNKDAEIIVFSRDSEDSMFPPVVLKDKKVRFFHQISKMGAPGIAIKSEAIKKYNLRFNEQLGTPNYFYNGEDSLFLYELIKKKVEVYSSSTQVFLLLPSKEKSSYFKNYDNHFFESVGGIQYLLHKHTYWFYYVKQAVFYRKIAKMSLMSILKSFYNGAKIIKKTDIKVDC